jgi:hypothetical protein
VSRLSCFPDIPRHRDSDSEDRHAQSHLAAHACLSYVREASHVTHHDLEAAALPPIDRPPPVDGLGKDKELERERQRIREAERGAPSC